MQLLFLNVHLWVLCSWGQVGYRLSGELTYFMFTCAIATASKDSIIGGIYKLVGLKQFYIIRGSHCGITYTVKHAKQLFMERAYFDILSHFWLSFLMAFNASACAMWPFSVQILTVHELWLDSNLFSEKWVLVYQNKQLE